MQAQEVISRCRMRGVNLKLDGDLLYAEPRGQLTARLVEEITKHKAEIIERIRTNGTGYQRALTESASTPEPASLDRTTKEREAYRWLLTRARDLKVARNDPAHKFMDQILRERRPALEDAYHDTSDDEFLQALRHWTAAGLKALRCGIEAEDELLERDGRVRSEGQAFRLVAGAQTPKGPRPDSEARERRKK